MLKDGKMNGSEIWDLINSRDSKAIYGSQSYGPTFGGGSGDFRVHWGSTSATLKTKRETYNVGSAYRGLHG